jgi:hypothetical protein
MRLAVPPWKDGLDALLDIDAAHQLARPQAVGQPLGQSRNTGTVCHACSSIKGRRDFMSIGSASA